jgi:hypothetical protein
VVGSLKRTLQRTLDPIKGGRRQDMVQMGIAMGLEVWNLGAGPLLHTPLTAAARIVWPSRSTCCTSDGGARQSLRIHTTELCESLSLAGCRSYDARVQTDLWTGGRGGIGRTILQHRRQIR